MEERLINKNELLKIKDRLEYVPDFWNVDEILEKDSKLLDEKELNILLQVKKEREMLNDIDIFLSKAFKTTGSVSMSLEESNRLNYIVYYSNIPSTTLNKLSKTEIDFVKSIVNKYDGYNEETIRELINLIQNDFVKNYAYHLLFSAKKDKEVKVIQDVISNPDRFMVYKKSISR